MGLVTVAQVDLGLRLDLEKVGSPPEYTDVRLPDIELKIEQATDIVIDYIKRPDHEWTVDDVPGQVSAAIILVIASLFDDFDRAEMLAGLSGGDLKNPVVGLLHRLRDPAMA